MFSWLEFRRVRLHYRLFWTPLGQRSGCPQARVNKRAEPKASDTLHVQALRSPYGVVYLAAKKYYFGVGGGTRQFKAVLEEDGELNRLFASSVILWRKALRRCVGPSATETAVHASCAITCVFPNGQPLRDTQTKSLDCFETIAS